MTALYYCSDLDLTDQLPDSLTNSPIDTSAKRDVKLRGPARDWGDSVYPGQGQFAPVAAQTVDWLVNQSDHAAGDTTVTIDGGTGNPVEGDWFRIEHQNTWYKISAYASNVITYASNPPDWNGQARAAFPDNARIYLGTPGLIRSAATWWASGLGILLLRRQPEVDAAKAAFESAKLLLGVRDGIATVEPWAYTDWADDAPLSPPPMTSGEASLVR